MTDIKNLDGVLVGHSYIVGRAQEHGSETVVIFYPIPGVAQKKVTFRGGPLAGHMISEENGGLARWEEYQVMGD